MAMLQISPSAVDWQPALGEPDGTVRGLQDVEQCLRVILATPRGSVPHEPDFGCDIWLHLDSPPAAARPHVIREVLAAITRWEPRVQVVRVEADESGEAGHLDVTVEWRLRQALAADPSYRTSVTLG